VNEQQMSTNLEGDVPGLPYPGEGRIDLADFVVHLQDLLVDNVDVHGFLTDLATMTAAKLSGNGNTISCGVTVIRRKKPVAVASSDAHARTLDELQNNFGDGPCLTALRTRTVIHVPDVFTDHRWSEYMQAAGASGIGSILAVPMELHGAAEAVVNLYSPRVHGFSYQDILSAETLAGTGAKAVHLALKIAQLSDARDNLVAALASRTIIDTAVGAIMAENRCSHDAAFQILVTTSNHRNIKLRALAADIVARISGEHEVTAAFEE
jgi:GAF domain-containing protein